MDNMISRMGTGIVYSLKSERLWRKSNIITKNNIESKN